jgi:hypothetical protein
MPDAPTDVRKAITQAEAGVTKVDLSGANIGDAGATQLADMLLWGNTRVAELSLGFNNIGVPGAQALASGLQHNTTVTKIDLGHNQIGDEGASALATMLRQNETVTEIFLNHNQIPNKGARQLAEMLQENKTVTTMFLSGNQIGDTGADALKHGMRQNATVTSMLLGLNPRMSTDAKKAVLDVVQQNYVDPETAAMRAAYARDRVRHEEVMGISDSLGVSTNLRSSSEEEGVGAALYSHARQRYGWQLRTGHRTWDYG